jgi:tetratricopeptide (TPR) repeat protein
MSAGAVLLVAAIVLIGWAAVWMLSQKPVTNIENLLHQNRYEQAAAEAEKQGDALHRGEALKLMGRFQEAATAYRRSDDPAAQEGIALSLAHTGGNLDEAKSLMEQTIAAHPQIQEFQALALAYILLRRGERSEALRLFEDNRVLLETRFHDDYTDPDPLLAETLWLFAQLCEASGDPSRARQWEQQAASWAPGSVWEARVKGA